MDVVVVQPDGLPGHNVNVGCYEGTGGVGEPNISVALVIGQSDINMLTQLCKLPHTSDKMALL